jgi:hypothetical protein
MDFEQISGTSDIPNKADNIITVIREYDEEKLKQGISGRIQVSKNRYWSELPIVKTHYDTETGMLLEIEDEVGDYLAYSFGFEKYLKEKGEWEELGRIRHEE